MEIDKLKFPIGEFTTPKEYNADLINQWITDIELFPSRISELTESLMVTELNWKYRPDGWSIKQVVHHCSDSHLNSIIRFKLTLTEDLPEIRPYFEDRWAELTDGVSDDISDSLTLIKALHKKWVLLLRNINSKELLLNFVHPEHGRQFSLQEAIAMYAWHCNHHLAHIRLALDAKGNYN